MIILGFACNNKKLIISNYSTLATVSPLNIGETPTI